MSFKFAYVFRPSITTYKQAFAENDFFHELSDPWKEETNLKLFDTNLNILLKEQCYYSV